MDNRKKIIDSIINELNGRSGFDDWWCNIDEDTQEEIEQTLVNTLPIHVVSFSRAQEYAEFVVMCEREGRPLLLIQDYLKHY